MNNGPEFEGSTPENLNQQLIKTSSQRGRLRFGFAGVMGVIAAAGLAVLVCVPSSEAPKPEVATPSFRQTFEVWVTLPPVQATGDYLRSYTLVADKNVQTTGIHNGYNYLWSLEVDDKTGIGRPFFEGLIPDWQDATNSHLAYRNIGASNSTTLLPNTTHHLVTQSFSKGNLCVMELFVDNEIVDRNERWNHGDPNKCIIPASNDGLATIGLPPERLGGISGHEFPGRVLNFRNTQ